MKPKNIKLVKDLKQELLVAKAQDLIAYDNAIRNLVSIIDGSYFGSGMIIKITNLSGNIIVNETLIHDGISKETKEALLDDIKRSLHYRLTCSNIPQFLSNQKD